MSASRFPIFDLLALESATAANGQPRDEALHSLRTALKEQGLLYVTNTGVNVDSLAEQVKHVTEPVMNLPPDETASLTSRGVPMSGLSRFEAESVAKVMGKGSYSDLCAKWSYNHTGDLNVLPPDADGSFRCAWASAHAAWDDIAVRLLALIGQALDLTENARWQELFRNGQRMATLRLLRYPDVSPERASDAGGPVERMAPHHDIGVITLLHQTPCANGFVSLQGLVEDEWVGVPAVRDSLVVNFGEVLSMLTDGAVKATMHRVLSPSRDQLIGSARRSLVMFWQPPPDFIVKPLKDTTYGDTDATDLTFSEWFRNAFARLHKQPSQSAAVAAE
mmetsp:Transcript_28581/g.51958  ORF Transcript_28581/g.51958 Transcript_28581/m.51958 type:complete len:335 (-) Transcript_28581:177-1181(-)